MRRLMPEPTEVAADALGLYDVVRAEPRTTSAEARPVVVVNMVSSLDGATAVQGLSGGLGGPADRAWFRALRALADVVLVGSGTVNAERYRFAFLPDALEAARRAEGRPPRPRIAIVSGRLSVDPTVALLADEPPAATDRPLVFTTSTGALPSRRAAVAACADLVDVGDTALDVPSMLSMLHDHGARVVLCEGGPTLNRDLFASGAVDEVRVTISPLVVAGSSARLVAGAELDPPSNLTVERIYEDDGTLFVRATPR